MRAKLEDEPTTADAAASAARKPAGRASDGGARAGGKTPRSAARSTPAASPGGSDMEGDGAQPPRKRFRELFPTVAAAAAGAAQSADADGAAELADANVAERAPPGSTTPVAAARAGSTAATPSAAAAGNTTPVHRKRPLAAGSAGKPSAGKRASVGAGGVGGSHGLRKSLAVEDEELLRARIKGRRTPLKAVAEPVPVAADERAKPACCHTDCDPAVQPLYAQLCHLLCARPRRWTAYEWFYPLIDLNFFKPAESEFHAALAEAGLGHVARLTRVEWAFVRGLLGRPRRVSAAFLNDERESLIEHRARARAHGLAARLAVGQRVTAFHPKVRQLHLGSILTPDGHDAYRVQFDRPELGVQLVTDFQLLPHEPPAAGPADLGAEAYAALREHHALLGMDALGAPSLAALRSLDALSAPLGRGGGGSGCGGGAAAAAGATAGLLAGSALRAGVGPAGWGAIPAPFLALGACGGADGGVGSRLGSQLRTHMLLCGGGGGGGGAAGGGAGGDGAGADAAPPSAEQAQLAAALSLLLERKARLVRELCLTNDQVESGRLVLRLSAQTQESAETGAIKAHYEWLLDELEKTTARVEPLKRLLAAAVQQATQHGAAGASGRRRGAHARLAAMMQRSAATADSILADALRTTRATEPALAPGISSLVSSALALLLHVQAAAATPLPADEAILLLESSLAALQPKAGSNALVFREVTSALSAICGLLAAPHSQSVATLVEPSKP